MSQKVRIAGVVLGLFGLLVFVAVLVVDPPEDEPTAQPSPTPSPMATAQQTPTSTPVPTATTAPTLSATDATPTYEEALLEFLVCDRLVANLSMRWGQAPGTIYSDDPRVSGDIEPGDYVRLLMPEPDSEGFMRVKVFSHDGRAVGKTDDSVWINWGQFEPYRTDLLMFTCED